MSLFNLDVLFNNGREALRNTYEETGEMTQEIVKGMIDELASAFPQTIHSEAIKEGLQKRYETEFQITMPLGQVIVDPKTFKPWLSEWQKNEGMIDWFCWNRYKQRLSEKFSLPVVASIHKVTDEILDLLQNPKEPGPWQRKGLVLGHVQSGKTANYAAVMCKAIDVGYKIIIVLSGVHNSLRSQTQQRIDYDVIGRDSSQPLSSPARNNLVGVGKIKYDELKSPISITTVNSDFQKTIASSRQQSISGSNNPIIFVIKKQASILKNLIEWLEGNNPQMDHPMLIIDDEADNASINTNKPENDPTIINNRIRKLLGLSPRNVYLGYTATPFANIFIAPDSIDEMEDDDLFPRDFIKVLEAPNNYFGSNEIFLKEKSKNKFDVIRFIDDYHHIIPLKHTKEELPERLPDSLKESIRCFVMIKAIRILLGEQNPHNSMLINVSRFTDIQSCIKLLVFDYLDQLKSAIGNYYKSDSALGNNEIQLCYQTWEKEFSKDEFSWPAILDKLNEAVMDIEVLEINSSKNSDSITYDKSNYPNGRSLIAVGGLSLSRGLTLEGLTTTYFLRNTMMYDTLMQMGRWFGYRIGYEQYCRIYMTEEAESWYQHIAEALDELRYEIKKMGDRHKTPLDFGLCVRNHPDSLIVTARNKMRATDTILREIDLSGRFQETSRIYQSKDINNQNLKCAIDLLKKVKSYGEQNNPNVFFWANVNKQCVLDFIAGFQNHPSSQLTATDAILGSIDKLDEKNWNVHFVSVEEDEKVKIEKAKEMVNIGAILRKKVEKEDDYFRFGSRRVGSGNVEFKYSPKGEYRKIPLLVIYLLDCRLRSAPDVVLFPNGTIAYGIAFPGEKNSKKIKASYQVNQTWLQNEDEFDDE